MHKTAREYVTGLGDCVSEYETVLEGARKLAELNVDALPDTLGHAPDGSVPGMLVQGDDVEALAVALRRWLTEPALRSRLRASARLRRETLTGWDATARGIANVLLRQEAAA